MINKILFLTLLLILFSCSNKKIEYDANGNKTREYELINGKIDGIYKEFYKDGNLKAIHNYNNGIKIDSSTYYNANGNKIFIDRYLQNDTVYEKEFNNNILISEGKYLNKNAIGKWKYYNKNQKLDKIFEYVNLCGDSYANQCWYFDEKGDTIKKLGNYYEIKFSPKIIKKNEIVCLQMTYKPIIYLNSEVMLFIDTENKVSKDFCNINDVKLAEFNITSNILKTYVKFESSGQKNFRGYIKEYFNKEPTKKDSTIYGETFVYFDIPITVN